MVLRTPNSAQMSPVIVRLSGLTLMPMSERCWWGRAHKLGIRGEGPPAGVDAVPSIGVTHSVITGLQG